MHCFTTASVSVEHAGDLPTKKELNLNDLLIPRKHFSLIDVDIIN